MPNFQTPTGRQPRGLVKINGTRLDGWIEAEVTNNSYHSADTFRVTFAIAALSQNPVDTAASCDQVMNANWFCNQSSIYVEVFMGEPSDPTNFGPDDLTSWIYGKADDVEYDPVANTITLTGRDQTRVFLDAKTTFKWPNLTSSQIVEQLADSHGLDTVATQTKTKAGSLDGIDFSTLQVQRSEWDILNMLADLEGFVVYVRGQTLFFRPKPDPATADMYPLVWNQAKGASPSANFQHIGLRRSMLVANGIQVTVKSWDKRQATWFTGYWPPVKTLRAVGGGPAQIVSSAGTDPTNYSKKVAGCDQEKVNQLAQNWYEQLIQHEMSLELRMPGPGRNDAVLDVTSIISLTGTGTTFDQTYYPDSINRSMSFHGGYEVTVRAKNHSSNVQGAE